MSEQTPNETRDDAETIALAYRATTAALETYASGLRGLSANAVATMLLGAAGAVVAAKLGPEYTAAVLIGLADQLNAGRTPPVLN